MKNFKNETIEQKLKKCYLPNGFLTIDGHFTQNSVTMYSIYLRSLPENWDITKLYPIGIKKVREHFGVDYGFSTMIYWGISYDCNKSSTSSGRHIAMNNAMVQARTFNSMGGVISSKKIKSVLV